MFQQIKNVVFLIGISATSLIPSTACHAQARVQPDEKVKVKYLSGWIDGKVIETRGLKSMIEYEFAGRPHQKVFERKDIRKLNEVDALDYSRTWKSADGAYKIKAALKGVLDEKATLIKEDMKVVDVPLSKLSKGDVAYVTKLMKETKAAIDAGAAPAITPKLPEISDLPASAVQSLNLVGSPSVEPLGASPSYLKFSQRGQGFHMLRDAQELVSVIPVGGPQELVLVSARESNRTTKFQSQLYWLSMTEQKVVGTIPITPEDYVLDYDPRSKLMVSLHKRATFDKTDIPAHYTVWRLKPGETTIEPLIRWKITLGTFLRDNFAKVVNDQVIVAKTDKNTYVAWNLVERKSVYSFKTQSFFDAPVVLTPNRKWLLACEDEKVSIIDAATGKLKSQFKLQNDRGLSGVNVNAAGTKLAGITGRNVHVWDLASGQTEAKVYKAPHVGSPFRSRIEWIDDDLILCDGLSSRTLFRLSLELPVWSYKMDVPGNYSNRDPLKNLVINGMFFYFAKPDFRQRSLTAIGVVELPGPKVNEITSSIDRKSLDALAPGARVAIEIGSVSDPQFVQQHLMEKVKANQWVVDPGAEIKITANMGIGKSQTIQYQNRVTGKVVSVTFQPHWSNLKIMRGNTVLWQSGTSTGAPGYINGENPQATVSQYQKPNLNFFERATIPDRILDPKYSRGFGVSKLGIKGIEVASTTPPGRESDPDAAATEADEKRKKENLNPDDL